MMRLTNCSLVVLLLAACSFANAVCDDDSACTTAEAEPARGSAMLQAKSQPSKQARSSLCSSKPPSLMETHLKESRTCLPEGLQEKHLQSMRRHAAMLASGSDGKEVE